VTTTGEVRSKLLRQLLVLAHARLQAGGQPVPDIFEFAETVDAIGDTQFGILSAPRLARTEIGILDGQLRILGLHVAVEDIAQKIAEQRNLRATAHRQNNPELVRHYEEGIRRLEEVRARLNRERISIQIHIEDEQRAFEQMFVDIADNALGITSAICARFDNRKVVNRSLEDVLKHALLAGRVDMEQDRVGPGNPNLLGAKHVADIIRAVNVGISGRVGRRQETELRESQLVEKTNAFLDVLLLAFPALEDVVEGKKSPPELRRQSLLGSTTMLRVLAGAFHELSKDLEDLEVADYFAKLSPFMDAPVRQTVAGKPNPWLSTGVFPDGAMGPTARTQDLVKLVNEIVSWYRRQPEWLEAA
jgi:DndB-like DNA-sulfur modification-associated protein